MPPKRRCHTRENNIKSLIRQSPVSQFQQSKESGSRFGKQ
jgi:hypothetical protein